MKSMTGYGYTEEQNENFYLMIEMKSYNNRYCDIFVNTPPYLGPLEQKIREYLSTRVKRGRIEFSIRFKELEENLSIILDKNSAMKYLEILSELAEMTAPGTKPELASLLQMEGIIKIQRNNDIERYWNLILPYVDEVFYAFEESRLKEGKTTEEDITNALQIIKQAYAVFSENSSALEQKIIEQLKEKFSLVLGDDFDQNRLLTETAIMLVKYSIAEEISRLGAHIKSFEDIMANGSNIGKKLDFLCQEMNREINTVGSKSIILEVNEAVVNAKDGLERIREQLRNVE